MYHKSSVEVFLVLEMTHPGVISRIQARMEEVADEDGIFTADRLGYIMGEELAEAYRQACAKNPALMLAEKPTEVPHSCQERSSTKLFFGY